MYSDETAADRTILKGTRVLLADDDAVSQTVTVRLLEAVGMDIDVASDGAAVVEKALANNYEIILMATHMPKQDTVTVIHRIREQERLAELPIVAIGANTGSVHEDECPLAGMDDFLAKSSEPGLLYALIEKWVTGQGNAAAMGVGLETDPTLDKDCHRLVTIPGLDVRGGLRRVWGMKALYVKVVQTFVQDQGDIADRLRQAVAARDFETANRDAHTFKGLVRTIEARELIGLSLGIESALMTADYGDLETLLTQIETVMVPLLAAIQTVRPNQY